MLPIRKVTLGLLLIFAGRVQAQPITYSPDESIIANPERGFYHHTEVHSGNYANLNPETLAGYRTDEAITQILRVFYLEKFRESPISTDYLSNMRKDFAAARSAGIKVIVRFAYSTGTSAPYNDATPDVVQMHIDQLKPVLRENADVIAVMQAGFVGTWGEWYYTDHFANSPGLMDEEDWENRRQVVYSLLEALTPDRMLQIRTPGYKMKIFESQEPLNETTAFSGSYASRLGHHNDCFVASSSDFGTYVNPDVEKPYLNQETFYTAMGGETCALASPYSDCENSVSELERFHWSYLNRDYNTQVLNEWDNQGCFDEIELKLGYRYELLNGAFTTEVQPGGTFEFDLNLQNIGYSNPYNPRGVEIILRNQTSGERYMVKPETDIRLWPLGDTVSLTFSAGIPVDMTEGSYDLILNLPDPYETLHDNPTYAIQMANTNVWEPSTGYNNLNHTLTISATATQPEYMGSIAFKLITQAPETLQIDGSTEIFGSSDSKSALIYWGRQANTLDRIIERSIDGNSFTTIASLRADQDYYLDTDITPGETYIYRYYLTNGNERTATSAEIALSINDITFPTIEIDGAKADWGTTALQSSASNAGNTYTLRTYFDASNMNLLLEGPVSDYKLYVNTDNDNSTGYTNGGDPINGADYLIADGALYNYTSDWALTEASLTNASVGNILEISISLDFLENLQNNATVTIYGGLNSEQVTLSAQDGNPSKAYRNLPSDLPTELTVENSTQLPKTRLLINWSECNYCDGYILERSMDQEDFMEIGRFDAGETSTRDDNLQDQTTYHYRMATFNELGTSVYSQIVSGTTGVVLGIPDQVLIHPNPTGGPIDLSKTYETVEVWTVNGQLLKSEMNSNQIDISSLKKGVYILKVSNQRSVMTMKVIRQ